MPRHFSVSCTWLYGCPPPPNHLPPPTHLLLIMTLVLLLALVLMLMLMFTLMLMLVLMLCGQVIVSGIPSVERAVISKEKDGKHNLLVEGTNMQAVMATAGG